LTKGKGKGKGKGGKGEGKGGAIADAADQMSIKTSKSDDYDDRKTLYELNTPVEKKKHKPPKIQGGWTSGGGADGGMNL
jgi:hypothetical protein